MFREKSERICLKRTAVWLVMKISHTRPGRLFDCERTADFIHFPNSTNTKNGRNRLEEKEQRTTMRAYDKRHKNDPLGNLRPTRKLRQRLGRSNTKLDPWCEAVHDTYLGNAQGKEHQQICQNLESCRRKVTVWRQVKIAEESLPQPNDEQDRDPGDRSSRLFHIGILASQRADLDYRGWFCVLLVVPELGRVVHHVHLSSSALAAVRIRGRKLAQIKCLTKVPYGTGA